MISHLERDKASVLGIYYAHNINSLQDILNSVRLMSFQFKLSLDN
jgi:hypothetical protein